MTTSYSISTSPLSLLSSIIFSIENHSIAIGPGLHWRELGIWNSVFISNWTPLSLVEDSNWAFWISMLYFFSCHVSFAVLNYSNFWSMTLWSSSASFSSFSDLASVLWLTCTLDDEYNLTQWEITTVIIYALWQQEKEPPKLTELSEAADLRAFVNRETFSADRRRHLEWPWSTADADWKGCVRWQGLSVFRYHKCWSCWKVLVLSYGCSVRFLSNLMWCHHLTTGVI